MIDEATEKTQSLNRAQVRSEQSEEQKTERKVSENQLAVFDTEKKPLEGASCGRNEDSEITGEGQNGEESI